MNSRFASIKAGRKQKLIIAAICRCCGLENDEKYPILGEISDDGVEFKEKLSSLTGICVHRTDSMPQNICTICMDKINDFYEFRLMSLNTEKQTREALGLPLVEQVKKSEFETKSAVVRLVDLKYSSEDSLLIERAFGRAKRVNKPPLSPHPETIPSTSKHKCNGKPATVPGPPAKKSRKDVTCTICRDKYFEYQSDLNDHLMKDHVVTIPKYACGSCRECFEQLSDYKSHESKHSRQKLPYVCYKCAASFTKVRDYIKHMTNYNCPEQETLTVTVDDIKCFQCKKKFLTQNLFEWHGCFLKTRASCTKCGKFYRQKKMLFKHYILCSGKFEAPESSKDPAAKKVKDEKAEIRGAFVSVDASSVSKQKGPKKKIVPPRKMPTNPNIVKKELLLDQQDDDYANYEEDITYDDYGNDSDPSDELEVAALEPFVQLQESQETPTVKIKQEKINDRSAIQQTPSAIDPHIIRNIKKEGLGCLVVMTQQQKKMWKLKIKSERGANLQSSASVLNPLAIGAAAKMTIATGKKVFKIPQALAIKIKKEKMDASYGDTQRDEAEADDDEFMNGSLQNLPAPVRIKQEKVDPAYGDQMTKNKKQFINPMALMLREKNQINGMTPPLEKSLIISAVTSINPTEETKESQKSDIADAVFQNGSSGEPNNFVMMQIPNVSMNSDRNEPTSVVHQGVNHPSEHEITPMEPPKGLSIGPILAPQNQTHDKDLDALLQ